MGRSMGRRAHRLVAAGSLALAALVAAIGPADAGSAPSPKRQASLVYLLRQDCGACHGLTLKGGLGPSLLPASLKGKSEAVLANIIIHGVPDTPMPPWAFEISHDEALWLARRLKKGLSDDR
jgi:cytochrome c55X